MKWNNFATFILTHGRPDNVLTYGALRKHGYTGPIYLIVDNEDSTLGEYKKKYGDQVIIFDKLRAAENTDTCDNYKKRNSVVFARNQNFIIAKEMGLKHFWQLDDDYQNFSWRIDNNRNECYLCTKSLDSILRACIQLKQDVGAHSIAMAQNGDYIGGPAKSTVGKPWIRKGWFSRKAMNSFIFDVDMPCTFRGRVNDDVNLYVEEGRKGKLFITIARMSLQQPATQQEGGGCTDIYLELGTYIKSFYSVMVAPSCVKIATLISRHKRIHHQVIWENAIPVIVPEHFRKV